MVDSNSAQTTKHVNSVLVTCNTEINQSDSHTCLTANLQIYLRVFATLKFAIQEGSKIVLTTHKVGEGEKNEKSVKKLLPQSRAELLVN